MLAGTDKQIAQAVDVLTRTSGIFGEIEETGLRCRAVLAVPVYSGVGIRTGSLIVHVACTFHHPPCAL
jgi:hypothetical protein